MDPSQTTKTDPNAGDIVSFVLPPGLVLLLGGTPLRVGPIDLRLMSFGAGATLDAQGLSRIFDVEPGARLQIDSLRRANGHGDWNGGKRPR